jgi:hypothetical protein
MCNKYIASLVYEYEFNASRVKEQGSCDSESNRIILAKQRALIFLSAFLIHCSIITANMTHRGKGGPGIGSMMVFCSQVDKWDRIPIRVMHKGTTV